MKDDREFLLSEIQRLRDALEYYTCSGVVGEWPGRPGTTGCGQPKLKNGECVRQRNGECGETARLALLR